MIPCRHCPMEAKTRAGLSSHLRAKHPDEQYAQVVDVGDPFLFETVLEGVLNELHRGVPSALAQAAISLAQVIDHPATSAREVATSARELRITMNQIRESGAPQADVVDELAERRKRRREAAGR